MCRSWDVDVASSLKTWLNSSTASGSRMMCLNSKAEGGRVASWTDGKDVVASVDKDMVDSDG